MPARRGGVPPPIPCPAHTYLAPAPVAQPCRCPVAATLRELNGSIAENIKAKTIVSWGVSAISADPENLMVYPCECPK